MVLQGSNLHTTTLRVRGLSVPAPTLLNAGSFQGSGVVKRRELRRDARGAGPAGQRMREEREPGRSVYAPREPRA